MAPMRSDRGGSPPRGARASLPLPRRLIRQIARHVASSGRSLRRLEVSGRVIENFDDIDNMTDEEEQMDTAVAAMACGGLSGTLPLPQHDDDLTSLSWLQDRNLLRGINLTTKSEEVQENKLNGNSVIVKVNQPESPPPAPIVHNKPPYSFSCLIFMAIEAAPTRALPVKEIYAWIIKHFPYFKTAPQGWKNSVRHNLSLNKCFHKVAAAPGLGKGSLWTVDPQHRTTLLQLTTNSGCVFVRPNSESSNENSPVKAESVIEKVETARAISGTMTGAISGAMTGVISGAMTGGEREAENGVTEPGTDEYIAAATVLAMKYGPRFLDQLPPAAHLVISRCNGDDHSYSGCEERRTAEALLNLAGITADSHTLVPS